MRFDGFDRPRDHYPPDEPPRYESSAPSDYDAVTADESSVGDIEDSPQSSTYLWADTPFTRPEAPVDRPPATPERVPDGPTGFLARVVELLDWTALATPDVSQDEHRQYMREVEVRLAAVGSLIDRLRRLPLVPEPEVLATHLTDLSRTDVGACLQKITQTCEDLGAPNLTWKSDTDGWIALLTVALETLERRPPPEVSMVPAPDGSVEGKPPVRAVSDLTIRDSRAVMYGIGNSLHVVHDCAVERPVIEVAELLDYDETSDTDAWFHSLEPVRYDATAGMQTEIIRSTGVSVGTGNHQQSVFVHRIGSCPVNLGVLIAVPRVRQAILDYHQAGEETAAAMTVLHKAVRRAVAATDISALVPDGLVARLATAQQTSPGLSGRGPRLTIRHGAGISVGWGATITTDLKTKVGKPEVQ